MGYSQRAVKLCISHGCKGWLYTCCLMNGGVDLGRMRCVHISCVAVRDIYNKRNIINFDNIYTKTRKDYTNV